MYIKVYFGDKPLFLCNAIDNIIQPYVHHDDAVYIDELNTHTVKSMIHEMEQQQVHAGVFYHSDFEELKKTFFKKFSVITAAGGLVKNEKDEILMIFRRGKWDLPKGKLDKNEKPEVCAVREVKEETGLKNVKLEQFLLSSYHAFHEGTRHILKETHWFAMNGNSKQPLQPQTEEDITEIEWVNHKHIENYLQKAFPLIRDVIQAAAEKEFIAS
jgi:ADP-ribose pyrophosphatase YjhB (NUDIX family)